MSNKKQFAFPLVVSGTQQELDGLIPELENLGYVWHGAAMKIINDGDIIRTLGGTLYTYKCISSVVPQNCLTVAASNRPLVLALAAACTNDRWQEKEWMIYVPNGGWQKVNKMWGYSVESTTQYRRPTLAEIQHTFRQYREIPNTKHTSMCMLKAHDDEPIFVLRANDPTSPSVIQSWISANKALQPTDKIDSARAVIKQMQEWFTQKHATPPETPVVKESFTTQLIPFDLEKAKSGDYEVVCRNGETPREHHFFTDGSSAGILKDETAVWFKSGINDVTEDYDLFLKPKVKTILVGLHPDGHKYFHDNIEEVKENEADAGNEQYMVFELSTDGIHKLVHDFNAKF